MVSPRERSRAARRRIAGERSRSAGTRPGPAAPAQAPPHPPTDRTEQPATAPEAAPSTERAVVPEPPADATAVPAAESGVESGVEQPAAEQGHRPDGNADGGPPTWVPAVLAALLVAALALDGFLLWKQQRDEEAAARALHSAVTVAPSVAERAAEAVLSYRHDSFSKDIAESRRYLSAGYRPDYIASIRDVVEAPAAELGAVVEAKVLASGVVEASGERSNVLLFVDQTTTTAADRQPRTALNRVVFTMVPRDGTWKVDEIRAF